MGAKHKVADILRHHEKELDGWCANPWKSRTLHAIRKCRTAELGGHIDKCNCCNRLHLSYNSCRNRHCPTCQGHKREQWIEARREELLEIPYFHVVFTIPHELNGLCLANPKLAYATLFKTAWATLAGFSKNPTYLDARIGAIMLLHTWGSNLSLHPHLHCIVPSGGVDRNGEWKRSKNKGGFLFPVKEMSRVFRAKFVGELRKKKAEVSQEIYDRLFSKDWVVFSKQAFGTPNSVVEYLGRYSHKIAITNSRIVEIDNQKDTVTINCKNYREGGKKQLLTLTQKEFVRRFSMHILPKGFTRIRHYGILSGTWKKQHLKQLQEKLNRGSRPKPRETKLHRCPYCKKGTLEPICVFPKNRPPPNMAGRIKTHNRQIDKDLQKG